MEHALEALSPDDLAAAVRGYRFFALEDVAALLERVANASKDELERADSIYVELVPSDQVLVERFEAFHRISPEVFAPLEP